VKDKEEAAMQSKLKWFAGAALAGGLLVGSLVATGVSAQTATPPGSPGPGLCPGYGMMGGGFGPGARVGACGPGTEHEAIANALGITSQELWDARTAGKSVAELAREKNVDVTKVVDAALAAHTAQLGAAVKAGTLTQAQAEAMKALMKSHIDSQFQTTAAAGSWGPGMMGGRGMIGSGFGPRGRGTP
jgi:hypothetical protein